MEPQKSMLSYFTGSKEKVILLKHIEALLKYLETKKNEQQEKLDALIALGSTKKKFAKFLHMRKLAHARSALIKSPLSARAISKNEDVRMICKLMQFNGARADLLRKKVQLALEYRYADSKTIAEALKQFIRLYPMPEKKTLQSRKQLILRHQ